MTLKKIISFFTLFFVIFSTFIVNVEAATFIQKSARQNSEAVATNDPVTVNKRNAVVLDLSNIIEDLASLKQYVDDNINSMFVVTPTRMENTTRNINIWKQLLIGWNLKGTSIDISEGWLKDNTINSANIKNWTVKKEDFENWVQFWNEELWSKNWLDIYYNDWNVAIWKDTASEKLEIQDWNLKIKTNWNGIQYPDWTFQTTAFKAPTNVVHLTGDQEVDWNKRFMDDFSLKDQDDWKLVYTQDINNVTWWSYTNDTSTCWDRGTMVGWYARTAWITNEKTFNLWNIPHSAVKVVLDYYAIDSWDGEKAFVKLDWTRVFYKTPDGTRINKCWRPNADSWGERKEHIEVEKAHTWNTLKVSIGSTLNQDPTDESFAFNNLKIYVKTNKEPINNVKGKGTAFRNPDHKSLVTTEAIRDLVKNNKTTKKVAVCWWDNGRRLDHEPTLLCESGTVQNKASQKVLLWASSAKKSCAEIKEANPKAQSGVYTINPWTWDISVYCDMNKDWGWWMLVLKADWFKETFKYSSSLWTNSDTYHPNDFQYDHKEYKSPLFNTQKFSEIMLEFESLENITKGERHHIQFAYNWNSLRDVFNSGTHYINNTTREDWTNLLPKNWLQSNCNAMWFNITYWQTDVRLGISANNENNCGSNDSNLGIWLAPRIKSREAGKPQSKASVGNNVFLTDYMAFWYLFIREKKPNIPLEKDCVTLKEKYNLGSWKYKVKPNWQEIEVYCDMETDWGWWMKILDNAKYWWKYYNTYTLNKNYWNAKEFMAKQRSGYVTCATNRTNETNVNWNRCVWWPTFELKYNWSYLFQQPTRRKAAPGCQRVKGWNSPMICKRGSSVSINNWTKLAPTWYEPSRNTSTGDNGWDLFIDLYARERKPQMKVLKNCREIKEQYKDIWSGVYTINPWTWNIEVYCDMETEGGWWTLIWRWREWWAWNNNWKNDSSVSKMVGEFGDTSSDPNKNALKPAYYWQSIVKSIIGNKKMNQLPDWLRLRRAQHKYATSWQEVRWHYKNANDFSWTFESKYPITMTIDWNNKSVGSDYTRDTWTWSWNDVDRVFTRSRRGHNRKRWFAYWHREAWSQGTSDSNSYLWEYNNNNHAIPYTEVYIRDKAPDLSVASNAINSERYKTLVTWECKSEDNLISKCWTEVIRPNDFYSVKIVKNNGVREYSNWTQAKSCKEYKIGSKYPYEGDTWNWYYYIKPSNSDPKIKVYCDMTTDGGWYTRYFYSKGNYSNTDIFNCFKGSVIDNSTLECFNPHKFNMVATEKLFAKRWWHNYFRDIPNDSLEEKQWTWHNRYCKWNSNFFSVMANHSIKDDYSNARYVRAWLDYCKYDRQIAWKDIGSNDYMNYSKNSLFWPAPWRRETSNRTTEVYFR